MGDEEEESSTICLFCEECFRNADNVWNHCVTRHGVDILKITRMHSKQTMQILWFLDFILVPNLQYVSQTNNVYNYCRSSFKSVYI